MSRLHPFICRFVVAAALAVAAPAALAHGGEVHDHAPAAPATAAFAADSGPRTAAASPDFELVATLEGGRLALYLDRYATGEPVADARVEVESGAFRGIATPAGPGVYVLDGKPFAVPGRHALAVTVEAGDLADLLSATLETLPPAPPAHVHGPAEWVVWGAAAGLLLAGVGLLLVRRRRQQPRRRAL